MRLVRRISIASLVVSVATLALVLVMFVGDRWESAEDIEHTPRLTEANVTTAIYYHIYEDRLPERPKDGWEHLPTDILNNTKGYDCFWFMHWRDGIGGDWPTFNEGAVNITYDATTDLWLLTSTLSQCNNGQYPRLETWTVKDNTGEIAYEVSN